MYDPKVVQEIKVITGYTDEVLNSQYKLINETGGETAYNVKIRVQSIKFIWIHILYNIFEIFYYF